MATHRFYKSVVAFLSLMLLLQYLYFYQTNPNSKPQMNSPKGSLFQIIGYHGNWAKADNQSSPPPDVVSADALNSSASEKLLDGNSCDANTNRKLIGFIKVDMEPPPFENISRLHSDLELGGLFVPKCTHTDKVAIIVPFRDRQEHLRIFLHNMHPLLKRQLIEYNIYVIEQMGSDPFNRAMLFNVGFVEAMKMHNFTCFVFHDVDLIPENDKNIYSCPRNPRHMSVAVDNMNYTIPYQKIFGGISALRKEHFTLVNGFSNSFWGWGGEDDDMANRIAFHQLYVSRYSALIARYKMLKHKAQEINKKRFQLLRGGRFRFKTDGLSNLNYTVEEIGLTRLYTVVKVALHKLPDEQMKYIGIFK